MFIYVLEPVFMVLFALLPFGLDNILLIVVKFYLILPGSGVISYTLLKYQLNILLLIILLIIIIIMGIPYFINIII